MFKWILGLCIYPASALVVLCLFPSGCSITWVPISAFLWFRPLWPITASALLERVVFGIFLVLGGGGYCWCIGCRYIWWWCISWWICWWCIRCCIQMGRPQGCWRSLLVYLGSEGVELRLHGCMLVLQGIDMQLECIIFYVCQWGLDVQLQCLQGIAVITFVKHMFIAQCLQSYCAHRKSWPVRRYIGILVHPRMQQ